MEECDFNVTIVGLGLIGASYAAAFKELNFKNVWGVDIDQETLNKAELMGIINKGYITGDEPISNSNLVIISLYPNETIQFVKDNGAYFKNGAIITDTAGLKSEIINSIKSFLPVGVDFIGGHPMAGREGRGIEMASKEIFRGASYIITPTDSNKLENIDFITKVAYSMGCGKVIQIDPENHDIKIAYTSQLPHIMATTLINSNEGMDVTPFVGGGFKDLTRIAISNSDLWTELLLQNKENLVRTIELFQTEVQNMKEAIINGNYDFIKEKFEEASRKRREIV